MMLIFFILILMFFTIKIESRLNITLFFQSQVIGYLENKIHENRISLWKRLLSIFMADLLCIERELYFLKETFYISRYVIK